MSAPVKDQSFLIHPDLINTAKKYFPKAFIRDTAKSDEDVLNCDMPLDVVAILLLRDSIESLMIFQRGKTQGYGCGCQEQKTQS